MLFVVTGLGCGIVPAQQPAQTHRASLMVQTGQSESVTSLAFSPDGHYAVVAGGRAAVLWDVRSGKELRQFTGHADRTWAVAYSPDGKYVLTGSFDHTARLWDAESGREIRQFVGHLDSVNAVAFSPDGRSVLTGSDDHSARLWDVETGKELRRFTGKLGPHVTPLNGSGVGDGLSEISAVAFSRNPDPALAGKYVVTGSDQGLQLWETASGKLLRQFAPRDGRQSVFWSIVCSPDGRSVATADSGSQTVQLWDLQSGRLAWNWSKVNAVGPHQALAFADTGQVLFVAGFPSPTAASVTALNAADGKVMIQLPPGGSSPVAFSQDGLNLLTGGPQDAPSATVLWDLQTTSIARQMQGQNAEARALAASPDGKALFTQDDDGAQVWDTASGTQTMRFMPGSNQVPRATSPDGKATLSSFSVGIDSRPSNSAQLKDATGKVHTLTGHRFPINYLGFSPDNRTAYTQSEDLAQVWEVSSGRVLKSFPTFRRNTPMDPPPQLGGADGEAIVSPDGKWILYFYYNVDQDTKVLHLKDAKTGKEVRQFRGHTAEVISSAFSADSRYALTGSYDDTMRLWDVQTGKLLQTYTGNTDIVMQVAFDSDPRYVISGSLDGVTTIWNRATGAAVVKLISFRDGGWAVVDAQGHYDASDPDNSGSLYWVTDNRRSIDLGQLKQEYYTPGLLARALNGDTLPDVTGMDKVALPPLVSDLVYDAATKKLHVTITNDGGGVGRLELKVNGRLLQTVEHAASPTPEKSQMVTLSLAVAPFLPDAENHIRVRVYNAANSVESVEAATVYRVAGGGARAVKPVEDGPALPEIPKAPVVTGKFYAIVVGTSEFANPAVLPSLQGVPSKDAESFAAALRLAAQRLYGDSSGSNDKIWMRLFTTDYGQPGAPPGIDGQPNKANIQAAFDAVHAMAHREDTLVVFMAGHGMVSPTNKDVYYYLTKDARSLTFESDPVLKDLSAVSSDELYSWMREPVASMPLKEVVILDTCAAGAAGTALDRLAAARDLPPDQQRAIQHMKDGTGTFVLMGAASDASSYQNDIYGHGLLTYALLEGMRSVPGDGELDVSRWFADATSQVPTLARNMGRIQYPLTAAPESRDFPVGMLSPEDRAKIVLPQPKPMVTGVLCEDADQNDPLVLGALVREQMRATGDVSHMDALQVMYIDSSADEIPGALSPKLQYRVQGSDVIVRIRLVKDGKDAVPARTVRGVQDDPSTLAGTVAAAIVTMAQQVPTPVRP